MIEIGKFNNLKVKREKDFGFYLGDEDKIDVLLPKSIVEDREINVDDELNVFVYRDSKDRPVATFKKPLAEVGEVAYLEVISQAEFGAFIDFGLDRDVFVPIKEQRFKLHIGRKYLFYLYLDKTGRIAATTKVEEYLLNAGEENVEFKVGDEVKAQVYSKSEGGTLYLAIDSKYKSIVLQNEYFTEVYPGTEMELRVKRIYEDGILGLTPRKTRLNEREQLQEKILNYLKENGGFMPFNDKSSPDKIKAEFNASKNYFKMALGGLMKEGKITQEDGGTRLLDLN